MKAASGRASVWRLGAWPGCFGMRIWGGFGLENQAKGCTLTALPPLLGRSTLMEHTERVHEEERTKPPDGADVRDVGPAGGASADAADMPQQVVNVKLAQSHVKGDGHHKSGASNRSDRTLYEILDDFAERLPPEIKDQFPEDFIENMDHYLYGAGKRWPPSS